MSASFIEDAWIDGEERTNDTHPRRPRPGRASASSSSRTSKSPRLEAYNAHRRASGIRVLTLEEYQTRCGWMATYRDSDDSDERIAAAVSCKSQDSPPPEKFENMSRELPIGMPDRVRQQIAQLVGKTRSYDVPKQEH